MELTLRSSRSAPAISEQTLVTAARRGDDRAFEELYARYRQRIFAFIVSKVRDHGRAEDIAQEVFISALRRLRSSDQPIAFKPWIYEIAKNACIDEFRRGTRSREVPLEPDDEPTSGSRPMMSVVPTPPDAVENRQRLDDLRGAFGGLSESHHQLLVLREFEGLSYDEIGERLGMTRQMVESGLFRARRKLGEEYDELASGRRCTQIQTAIESGSAQSITSLGVRDRRRFARHLAHCQACRATARMAGVDEALLKPRSIAAKIAALLPFPLWRWPWGGGPGARTVSRTSSRSGHLATGPLRTAARVIHPATSPVSLGQAAAAVAALAIAGAGAGLVVSSEDHHAAPSSATLAADATAARAAGQPSGSASSSTWPGAAVTPAGRAASAAALSIADTRLLLKPSPSQNPGSRTGTSPGASGPGVTSGTAADGLPLGSVAGPTGPTGANVLRALRSTVSQIGKTVDPTIAGVTGAVNSTVSQVKKTVDPTLNGVKKAVGSTGSSVEKSVGSATSGTTSASSSPPSSPGDGNVSGAAGAAKAAPAGSTASGAATSGSGAASQATGANPSTTAGQATGGAGSSTSSAPNAASLMHTLIVPAKPIVSGLLPK